MTCVCDTIQHGHIETIIKGCNQSFLESFDCEALHHIQILVLFLNDHLQLLVPTPTRNYMNYVTSGDVFFGTDGVAALLLHCRTVVCLNRHDCP